MKKCIDCNQEFDDALSACPNCGCPTKFCDTISDNSVESTVAPQQPTVQQQVNNSNSYPHTIEQPVIIQPIDHFDYSKLRIFFFVAAGFSLLGSIVVLCSDQMRGNEGLYYGILFLLLMAGIVLIGLGASIKN